MGGRYEQLLELERFQCCYIVKTEGSGDPANYKLEFKVKRKMSVKQVGISVVVDSGVGGNTARLREELQDEGRNLCRASVGRGRWKHEGLVTWENGEAENGYDQC